MSKITVDDKFSTLVSDLSDLSEQLEEAAEAATALFEKAGTDGIRYLCRQLNTILYVPLEVTPALAGAFLELENPNNRPSNAQTKDAYVRDMSEDKWLETGDGIRFDVNAVMQDGGHRCRSIQKAGTAIRTLVVFGIDPQAVHNIDSGRARTMANYLKFLGEKDVSVLQSVIPHLVAWDSGIVIKPARWEKRTRQEIFKYIEEHPEVRDFVTEGRRLSHQVVGLSPSAATLSMMLISRSGLSEQAAQFMEEFETGLTTTTAIAHLRNRLSAGVRRSTGRARGSLTLEEQLAYIITAWNRRHEDVKRLDIPMQLNDVNFPRVKEAGDNGKA